jgi:hypothetical protein
MEKKTQTRGRPRKPDQVALREYVTVRLRDGQRAKLDRLGGGEWMRARIDRAKIKGAE